MPSGTRDRIMHGNRMVRIRARRAAMVRRFDENMNTTRGASYTAFPRNTATVARKAA